MRLTCPLLIAIGLAALPCALCAADLPVVILNEKMDPETLIQEIRRELRAHLRGV